MIGANGDLIMPRAALSKLFCCAQLCCVLWLPVLRSDRQYGGNFFLRGGKNRGPWKINYIRVEIEKRRVVHNNTYYTRCCSMFEISTQCSTTQHRSEGHGATLRCWAKYSRTDLSGACIVIQQRSTWWYVPTWCSSTGMYYRLSLKVFSLVRIPVSSGEKNDPHATHEKNNRDISVTLWSSSR